MRPNYTIPPSAKSLEQKGAFRSIYPVLNLFKKNSSQDYRDTMVGGNWLGRKVLFIVCHEKNKIY